MKRRLSQSDAEAISPNDQARARILSVALKLLNAGGADAVTTRAVAEAAGVQPPILYRLFGDKDALLSALAEHGFTLYVARKQSGTPLQDPVEALRAGWDKHISFGLGHPFLYLLMYVQPQSGPAPAAELSSALLHQHMSRVAAAGRLRLPQQRAVALFHAAAMGIVLTLLRSPQPERDLELSSIARDHTLAIITTTKAPSTKRSPVSRAATILDAATSLEDSFSHGEFVLFKEWLSRLKTHK